MQGCPFRCYNCFNPETWDFNGGKEWSKEIENQIIELAKRPYIKRVSILGGEPLADENIQDVLNLFNKIRLLLPNKTIWLYTGYAWEEIMKYEFGTEYIKDAVSYWNCDALRQIIISKCDVLVDGRYEEDKRDITLRWRGSSNQRVIDVRQSIKSNKVVLYCQ